VLVGAYRRVVLRADVAAPAERAAFRFPSSAAEPKLSPIFLLPVLRGLRFARTTMRPVP